VLLFDVFCREKCVLSNVEEYLEDSFLFDESELTQMRINNVNRLSFDYISFFDVCIS